MSPNRTTESSSGGRLRLTPQQLADRSQADADYRKAMAEISQELAEAKAFYDTARAAAAEAKANAAQIRDAAYAEAGIPLRGEAASGSASGGNGARPMANPHAAPAIAKDDGAWE